MFDHLPVSRKRLFAELQNPEMTNSLAMVLGRIIHNYMYGSRATKLVVKHRTFEMFTYAQFEMIKHREDFRKMTSTKIRQFAVDACKRYAHFEEYEAESFFKDIYEAENFSGRMKA